MTFRNKLAKPRIGLALGGGSARGLAHIGVLKILEKACIKPDYIAGTSMGAIIGALYCQVQDAFILENKILTRIKSPRISEIKLKKMPENFSKLLKKINLKGALEIFNNFYMLSSSITKNHLINEEKIKRMLSLLLPKINIENLSIPFAAVAADLTTGSAYVFTKGPLDIATQASSALPGIFSPVNYKKSQLIDGVAVSLVPVSETFKLGADLVIAVDVSENLPKKQVYNSGIEIWLRANQITNHHLKNLEIEKANAVIKVDTLDVSWNAFKDAEQIISAGETAAKKLLPQIKKMILPKPHYSWWEKCWHFFKNKSS